MPDKDFFVHELIKCLSADHHVHKNTYLLTALMLSEPNDLGTFKATVPPSCFPIQTSAKPPPPAGNLPIFDTPFKYNCLGMTVIRLAAVQIAEERRFERDRYSFQSADSGDSVCASESASRVRKA